MQITNKSIREVLTHILSTDIILPALQREYVWKRRDIEGLFDSLLQEYPINTFMSWEVDDILDQQMEFYKFLEPQYKEGDVNIDYSNKNKCSKSVIIDGQQRLTSLYIALYGSYTTAKGKNEMFLYLNMDKPCGGVDSDEDSDEPIEVYDSKDLKYDFRFLIEADANKRISKGEHWLKVSEAFTQNFDYVDWLYTNDLRKNAFARETMQKLMRLFDNESKLLNFYDIHRNSLQEVLDIFVRANNGGKRLTKGDLLLSMITVNWVDAKENARKYVESIVDVVAEKGFKIDKDWVLKCFLFLLSNNIKMDVANFNKDVSEKIFANKEKLKNSIAAAFSLIDFFGIQEKGLTSKLAVLPIVYHIYYNNLATTVRKTYYKGVEKSATEGEYLKLRTWLFRAIVREFFTNGSDNKLKEVQNILKDKKEFPLAELIDKFKNDNANINIDHTIIDTLLAKHKKEAFAVLNIIYSDKINTSESYDIDHMHPQTDSNVYEGYDAMPNLQLLTHEENISKNDRPLKDWYNAKCDAGQASAIIIPLKVSLELSNFPIFYNKRKEILRAVLIEKLEA